MPSSQSTSRQPHLSGASSAGGLATASDRPSQKIGFWRRYVFSRDHKVIGIQYLMLGLAAVLLGMLLSLLMRANLSWPGTNWPVLGTLFPAGAPNGVMTPEFYLSLMTIHGTIMIFFVLTVAPQAAFGNYVLPLQIGAGEMAFPFLNMLSFWVTLAAFLVLALGIFVSGGQTIGPIGGWTEYPPLSAVGEIAGPGQGTALNLWIMSLGIFAIGSLLGSINFITTLLLMRAPGMSLMRLPLTCWSWFTTAILSLLSFPVLLAAMLLLYLDRSAGTSFFVPSGEYVSGTRLAHQGGLPILWQHLFWFFGHPEVYIAILPGQGVTSHLVSTFARKPIFGYRAMVLATIAIGLLGFLVWGHHMFVSGMSPYSAMAFSVLTLSIGVPSAIKTFNWIATLWGGQIRFATPMLFSIGFISLFVAGGLSGIVLGQTSLDMPMHDTYFVLGHFHLVMGAAAIFGIFAATYFWYPKMFGRMMSERLGKLHFWITLPGVYAIFVPFYLMGISGMPRRYAQMTEFEFIRPLQSLALVATVAAGVTIAAQGIFVFNFFFSMLRGARAADNPWEATSLEWTIASPPSQGTFDRPPTVCRGAYDFSVPGAPRDFLLQTTPPGEAG